MQKQQNPLKRVIVVLAALLIVNVLALIGTHVYKKSYSQIKPSATVPDNVITSGSVAVLRPEVTVKVKSSAKKNVEEKRIRLHKRNREENISFDVGNMFPGDKIEKNYCVQVSYQDKVTVHFEIDIDDGYEKLAEVLKCKVVLRTTGEKLYDGLVKDMPQSLDYTMKSSKKTTEELYYEITAYLDTSVGNEYQNKSLMADFMWWIEFEETTKSDTPAESSQATTPTKTGDTANLYLWAGFASASLILLTFVRVKRKKGEANDRQ